MFHRLSGEFVSGQMIFFTVVRGSKPINVCCEVVEFGDFLMRIIWHESPSG